jgi:hypothetical protein
VAYGALYRDPLPPLSSQAVFSAHASDGMIEDFLSI